MTTDYDAYYRENPAGLGPQTAALAKLISAHVPAGARVLDIGCGQGRDALPLARAGHPVVGVDLSPTGIAEMVTLAEAEGLPVTGIVADLTSYAPEGRFGLLLCDRTLHMLARPARHAVLARLIGAVVPGGVCLIADEPKNIAGLAGVIEADTGDWHIAVRTRNTLLARRVG